MKSPHCASCLARIPQLVAFALLALGVSLRAQDSTPPEVTITTPTDGSTIATLPTISGWATDDSGTVSSVTFSLHAMDRSGGL